MKGKLWETAGRKAKGTKASLLLCSRHVSPAAD